jgi:hypothetical protein
MGTYGHIFRARMQKRGFRQDENYMNPLDEKRDAAHQTRTATRRRSAAFGDAVRVEDTEMDRSGSNLEGLLALCGEKWTYQRVPVIRARTTASTAQAMSA